MRKWLLCLTLFTTIVFGAKPEKLTVILDWFPNPDHAPLIIAQQQGYFKEQGLDVQLIGPADPTDPAKWVAAGKADIGLTYEPELMEMIDRGLPLISIGSLIDKPLDCFVALKGAGINSLADLKGKKIATGSDGLSSIMLKAILTKAGLEMKDVSLINVHYNLTQALLSHQVDMAAGMMRNFEVPQLEATGHKVITFFPEESGIPNYSVLVFIANTKNIHDPRYPRFLLALKKAVRYIDEHAYLSWDQFAKAYPENNNAVNHAAWFATIPYLAEDPADLNDEDWQQFAKFMYDNHMIKTLQPVSRYAVILR